MPNADLMDAFSYTVLSCVLSLVLLYFAYLIFKYWDI